MLELEEELQQDKPIKLPTAKENYLKKEIDLQKAQIVKFREATFE